MSVVCDDVTTIFVDGEQKTVPGTGEWNQVATLQIPATTSVIGITCENRGGAYGIMVQVADSTGRVLTVSDHSWRCSNKAGVGWSEMGFRESSSWEPAAYYLGHSSYLSNGGAWRDMSSRRRVIWTDSHDDIKVYCRKELSRQLGEQNIQ